MRWQCSRMSFNNAQKTQKPGSVSMRGHSDKRIIELEPADFNPKALTAAALSEVRQPEGRGHPTAPRKADAQNFPGKMASLNGHTT